MRGAETEKDLTICPVCGRKIRGEVQKELLHPVLSEMQTENADQCKVCDRIYLHRL